MCDRFQRNDPVGIFDTRPLRVRADNLLALARKEHEEGRTGFAKQLRAQARRYLKESAAMDNRCDVGGSKGQKFAGLTKGPPTRIG
jgi:hypothetical protein